jgi:hypothetical protein
MGYDMDLVRDVEALMEEHPGCDWSVAAQAVAMARGISEPEVFREVEEYFSDPMGDMMGRNE